MNGILLINKPKGPSSFSYMKRVQKKLGIPKVGHLGTLDPAAGGLLVLLCGSATKLNQSLSHKTKVYQSIFTFGVETDTLDMEGKEVATSDVIPSLGQVKEKLDVMVGAVEIQVPHYSAVHIDGERAYDLARRGIDFIPPTKRVEIMRFELLGQVSDREFKFEIECQTGTYVRSLAKLLAQKLGTVAIASEITRTKVGEFCIEHAKTVEDVSITDIMLL